QEHRCEYRFRGKLTAHLGPSLEFPHIAAMPLLRNVDMKAVAGNHGTAKTRAVYRHEIDELPFRGRAQRVDHEHGRGLRHRLDNQHARHNRPRREMPLEVLLVDRDVLDPGCPLVGHGVNDLVDHQKRMTVRDHFHDPPHIDLDCRGFGVGRLAHSSPSFFLASRGRTAFCRSPAVAGGAGPPAPVTPASTSRITPALAAMRAPEPIFRWPASPACPPAMTKSPSFVLPE